MDPKSLEKHLRHKFSSFLLLQVLLGRQGGVGQRGQHRGVVDLVRRLGRRRLLLALFVVLEGAQERHHLPLLDPRGLLGAGLQQVDRLAGLLCSSRLGISGVRDKGNLHDR